MHSKAVFGYLMPVAMVMVLNSCAAGRSGAPPPLKAEPANYGDTQHLSESERQLRSQAALAENNAPNYDYARTIGEGAGIGCILGAVIAGLATQSARGAGIGCAVGGALGGVTGYAVARKKAEYIAREDNLDRLIAMARKDNEELVSMIQLLETVVAEKKAEIYALKNNYQKRKITVMQMHKELVAVNGDRQLVMRSIANSQEVITALNQKIAQNLDQFAAETNPLRQEANQLTVATQRLEELQLALRDFVNSALSEAPST